MAYNEAHYPIHIQAIFYFFYYFNDLSSFLSIALISFFIRGVGNIFITEKQVKISNLINK